MLGSCYYLQTCTFPLCPSILAKAEGHGLGGESPGCLAFPKQHETPLCTGPASRARLVPRPSLPTAQIR